MSLSNAIIVHSDSSAVSEDIIAQLQHDYGPDKQIYILNVNPPPNSGGNSVHASDLVAETSSHPVQYIVLNKDVDINVILQDPNILDQLSRSAAINSGNSLSPSNNQVPNDQQLMLNNNTNGGQQVHQQQQPTGHHLNHHHINHHHHLNEPNGHIYPGGHAVQHQHQHSSLSHHNTYPTIPQTPVANNGHLKSSLNNLQNFNSGLSNGGGNGLHSLAHLNHHHHHHHTSTGSQQQYHVPNSVIANNGNGNGNANSLLNISNLNLNSEESIQRVDVPPPKRKQIEFHFENKRFSYQDAFLRFLAGEKQPTLPEIIAEQVNSHHKI